MTNLSNSRINKFKHQIRRQFIIQWFLLFLIFWYALFARGIINVASSRLLVDWISRKKFWFYYSVHLYNYYFYAKWNTLKYTKNIIVWVDSLTHWLLSILCWHTLPSQDIAKSDQNISLVFGYLVWPFAHVSKVVVSSIVLHPALKNNDIKFLSRWKNKFEVDKFYFV